MIAQVVVKKEVFAISLGLVHILQNQIFRVYEIFKHQIVPKLHRDRRQEFSGLNH
jgi:hypothetical protein